MTDINAELVAARAFINACAEDGEITPCGQPNPCDLIERLDAALARARGTWPAEREVGRAVYERVEKLISARVNTPDAVERAYLSHLIDSVEQVGGYDGPRTPLAHDHFAISQSNGVGARYGVCPAGKGIPNTLAWFTYLHEAQRFAAEPHVSGDVWDLVEGRQVR